MKALLGLLHLSESCSSVMQQWSWVSVTKIPLDVFTGCKAETEERCQGKGLCLGDVTLGGPEFPLTEHENLL